MSAPWVIACLEAGIIAAILISRWTGRAGRVLAASDPEVARGLITGAMEAVSEPSRDEVEALKSVLVDVSKASDHGASLEEFAVAALTWMRGGGR